MDLEIVCRGCLLNTDAVDYFKMDEIGLNDQTYKEMLESVSGFPVQKEIEPDRLCENCGVILLELYKFKQTLQETQNILEQLNKHSIVQKEFRGLEFEPIDLDEEDQMPPEMESVNCFTDTVDIKADLDEQEYLQININDENPVKVKKEETIEEIMTKDEPKSFDQHCIACPYCSKLYGNYYILKGHLKAKHPTVKPEYLCKHCEKKFYVKAWMEHHESNCRRNKYEKTTCRYCETKFSSYKTLKAHVLQNHKDEDKMVSTVSIQCPFCNTKFRNLKNLKYHFNSKHLDQQNVKCDYCGFLSFTPQFIQKHLTNCKSYIESKKTTEFVCPYCPVVKIGKMKLENHIQACHKRFTNKVPFQCDICKNFLKNKQSLLSHMRLMHLPREIFKCKTCGYCYKSMSGLKYHISQHHSEKTTYSCHVCDYVTTQNFLLRLHLKRHVGEKTHQCPECVRTFSSLDGLKCHQIFAHSDERPFECQFCDRAYKTKQKLREHQKVHGGFRYDCLYCEKTFSLNRDLEQHVKRNHPEKICNLDI